MRQWYEVRQIPWSEGDYWTNVFYDMGLWVLWLLEPAKMANIESSVAQGKNRDSLLRELLGMELRAWIYIYIYMCDSGPHFEVYEGHMFQDPGTILPQIFHFSDRCTCKIGLQGSWT